MAQFALTARQCEAHKLLGGPQRHTMLVGGSRSGKTFVIVRSIFVRALRAAGSRHCILRFRYNAVRSSIWLDTLPKVQQLCFPTVRYHENRQDGYIELPNGSQIWFGGLDEKERVEKILGQEYLTLFFNECSQIPYSSVLVALTRLAQYHPDVRTRALYDLNPTGTGHWSYKLFVENVDPLQRGSPVNDPDDYAWMYLNPRDNENNIAPGYIRMLEGLPLRQRRRFLEGHYTAEVDGALWTYEGIEQCRHEGPLPEMRRVVIGVDPSGTAGKEDKRNDDIGIVAAGVDSDGTAYVLEDASSNEGPAGWGRRVCQVFDRHKADCVVAEANFGGEMVRHVIQSAAKELGISVPVHLVTASRGKAVRAEPVAALYEQGKVRHAGRFSVLEDQLLNFSTNGWLGEKSPDRADAAIWALTSLMVRSSGIIPICAPILATRTRVLLGDLQRNMGDISRI
jgi:predicted phage terminase large subunit-like protein